MSKLYRNGALPKERILSLLSYFCILAKRKKETVESLLWLSTVQLCGYDYSIENSIITARNYY